MHHHNRFSGYAFLPAILCAYICTLRFDAFLKTGICIALSTVVYYFTELVVDVLFGTSDSSYQVNLGDWGQYLDGNVAFISLISLLFIAAVFTGIGVLRIRKGNRR